ncbi:MAG: M42 family metallopeptidase [Candidatus Pacebacteria bacterium]|nr:M42 family metallopeptidase [Candidatus Paceibacterota bacterium]
MAEKKNENLERINSLLEEFSNAHGISGFEKNVREILHKKIKPFVDEIRVDNMGNLIATKKGKGPKIMIAAHMDEIGFMVKYVDDQGYIYFSRSGGWFDQTLLNQRVIIHTAKKDIYGVIGSKAPHVMRPEERTKVVEISTMYIDTGAVDKKDVEKMGIEVGDTITIDRKYQRLANDFASGKALDDRAGVVAMLEVARILSKEKVKAEVIFVGTVQEEIGLKGARTAAHGVNPDVALAIDTTIPGDHPGIEKRSSILELGKGAVITVSDAEGMGIVVDENTLNWLKTTAKENKMDYQLSVSEGGMTDAAIINLTREGIPSGGVSIATRYLHSPVEVVNLRDVDACAKLTVEAVKTAHKYFGK